MGVAELERVLSLRRRVPGFPARPSTEGFVRELLPLREAVSIWACAVHAVLDESRRIAMAGELDVGRLESLNDAVARARCRCQRLSASLSDDDSVSETMRIATLYGLQWHR